MTQTLVLTEEMLRAQVIETARSRLNGFSQYAYKIEDGDPPEIVNCITFVRWALEQHGLPMPSLTRHLLLTLHEQGGTTEIPHPGDLVFTQYPESAHSFYIPSIRARVSHVGILTDRNTVIHASRDAGHVVEENVMNFTREGTTFRSYVSLTSFDALALPERYQRGELSQAAAAYFELHVKSCQICRDSLNR